MSDIHSIFSTPVYESDIYSFSKDELKILTDNKNVYKNTYNTTSLNTEILEHKKLKKLKKFLEKQLSTFVYEHLHIKNKLKFYITQSWLNFNKPGEYHHKHRHPNSIISGVLFIRGNDIPIVFHKDILKDLFVGILDTESDYNSYNNFNCRTSGFHSKEGLCLFFPSMTEHDVMVNNTKETRISLSFNTFVSGTLGDERSLTLLKL